MIGQARNLNVTRAGGDLNRPLTGNATSHVVRLAGMISESWSGAAAAALRVVLDQAALSGRVLQPWAPGPPRLRRRDARDRDRQTLGCNGPQGPGTPPRRLAAARTRDSDSRLRWPQ